MISCTVDKNLGTVGNSDFSHWYCSNNRPDVAMPCHLESLPPSLPDTFYFRLSRSFQLLCIQNIAASDSPHLKHSSCLHGNRGVIKGNNENISCGRKKNPSAQLPPKVLIIIFNYIPGIQGEITKDAENLVKLSL